MCPIQSTRLATGLLSILALGPWVLLAASGLIVVGSPASATAPHRCVDGAGPVVQEGLRARRELIRERMPFAPPAPRIDVGDVAILEDDGTMMVAGVMVLERMIQEFYETHADSFDFVALYAASTYPSNVEVIEGGFATAYAYLVRSDIAGIGLDVGIDRNDSLGIDTQRLKCVVVMNDIPEYGATPLDTIPGSITGFTGVETLAHEAGHISLAFVNVDQVVPGANILIPGHWSSLLDGRASVMNGARWQDNLDGTFTVIQVSDSFSQLDQYVLGLRAPADVDSIFVIDSNDIGASTPTPLGTTVTGTRIDFAIEDVIAQNGARVPPSTTAQHDFRMAIALMVPYDTEPSTADLDFMNALRAEYEDWYFLHTDSLGTVDTSLPPNPVAADFTSDVFAGNAPFLVRFRDLSYGDVTARTWDFGDGSPASTEKNPEHTYTERGLFTVTLTVDGVGGPVQEVKPGYVTVGGLPSLFQDDFETDQGWAVGPLNDAITGNWERGDPEGTTRNGRAIQPEDDHTPSGTMAWVTGLAAGATATANDVDLGTTTLYSPIIDLSGTFDPVVSYARWFSNNAGQRPAEEPLTVQVSGDSGGTWVDLEIVNVSGEVYRRTQHRISDFVVPTSQIQFRFIAQDPGLPSLVEAVIDDFEILDAIPTSVPEIAAGTALTARLDPARPNPFDGGTVLGYHLGVAEDASVKVFDAAGRLVRILVRGPHTAGAHTVVWDGRDSGGAPVTSGVYFCRLSTKTVGVTRKTVIVRR